MTDFISWAATGLTIAAALMTAANLGARITGFGFALFTLGAGLWIAVGAMSGQPALLWTNIVLLMVDIFGVWRWLGRQARVEDGGRKAAEASERTPGEALFPVSLLASAPVRSGGEEVGRCVDAMAGGSSGRISYVVVAEGGVGGIGEHFFRLPWAESRVDGDAVVTTCRLDQLETIERDRWPAR